MSEWQRCPICAGRGVLNYPPGTPIGRELSTTSFAPWPCGRCSGTGTITTPVAQDRVHTPVKFTDHNEQDVTCERK